MTEKEQERLDKMLEYERELYAKGYDYICGIDEAGRGPLCHLVAKTPSWKKVILQHGSMDPASSTSSMFLS